MISRPTSLEQTGHEIAPHKMASKTFKFVFLYLVTVFFPPNAQGGWRFLQSVNGEKSASRVYEEAEAMDNETVRLDESVNFVHQYLVDLVNTAQKVDSETDEWKKRALLRTVQTRIEELRIGRKEIKKLLKAHRKTVAKVEKHAKSLKKKLPLWHDGIARKLSTARGAIARAESWLQAQKQILKSEKHAYNKHLQTIDLNKLPSLLNTELQLPSSGPARH